MLRRHPTSIAITTHDLAIFEKLYAQRALYTDQRESTINGDGYGEDPTGFGVSGAAKWAGKAARSEAGLEGGEARDEADREERRIKSTQERIQGITAAAAGAGAGNAGAGGASGNGSGSGGGGRGVGQTQQRR